MLSRVLNNPNPNPNVVDIIIIAHFHRVRVMTILLSPLSLHKGRAGYRLLVNFPDLLVNTEPKNCSW